MRMRNVILAVVATGLIVAPALGWAAVLKIGIKSEPSSICT